MIFKKTAIRTFYMSMTFFFLAAGSLCAQGQEFSFPTYGSGSIQVRLYTDYFCPPCRAMEPSVEPILKDLLRRNAITLTLVDVPYNHLTPLYARYFLYALKARNDGEHSFHVRNVLNEAATKNHITTEEHLAGLFKEKSILFTVYEAKPAFNRFNALIKEDKIQGTPTCIIVRDGKKEEFNGGPNVIAALKRLL